MWEFRHSEEIYHSEDELRHYGVKGMRWGVRRASKRLSKATTKEERDKAVSKLKKHQEKGSAKLAKAKKKQPKLEQQAKDSARANEGKASEYARQAALTKRSAYGMFGRVNQKKLAKAIKLEAKAEEYRSRAENAKAKMEHNRMIIEAYETELSNIDRALVDVGKKVVKR